MDSRRSGFTLIEILVASLIGVFIALVAVGTLKAVSVSAELVDKNIESSSQMRFATGMLWRDLLNMYRSGRYSDTRFIGIIEETESVIGSRLIFYTVGSTKARSAEPEGDIYEVEYFLIQNEDKSALMRRLWPNPNKEVVEGGGILTVIADDIDIFEVRYFDGAEWQYEWPEESRSFPQLVEVSMGTTQEDGENILTESFMVNLVRTTSNEAMASEENGGEAESTNTAGNE